MIVKGKLQIENISEGHAMTLIKEGLMSLPDKDYARDLTALYEKYNKLNKTELNTAKKE